jgi:hypothetical protein
MTSDNDALKLKIIKHVADMLMVMTNTDDASPALIEELEDEALLKADLILGALGLAVAGSDGSVISVNLDLQDINAYIEQRASEMYVPDTEL